jgi:hypothetical protein
MDSLDATLGVLAALQCACLSFLFDFSYGTNKWFELVEVAMGVPMVVSLFGVLGFTGRESPDLDAFRIGLKRSRKRMLLLGIKAMADDFECNQQTLWKKEMTVKVSVATFIGLLVMDILLKLMLK